MQEQVKVDSKNKESKSKKSTIDWREVFTHVAVRAAEGFVTGVAMGVAGLTVSSLAKSLSASSNERANNLIDLNSKVG